MLQVDISVGKGIDEASLFSLVIDMSVSRNKQWRRSQGFHTRKVWRLPGYFLLKEKDQVMCLLVGLVCSILDMLQAMILPFISLGMKMLVDGSFIFFLH